MLRHLHVQTISNKDCIRLVSASSTDFVDRTTLCAIVGVGDGPCFGDSGGPLVLREKLVGIFSWIDTVCGSERPEGYTRVSEIVGWIENVTGVIAV